MMSGILSEKLKTIIGKLWGVCVYVMRFSVLKWFRDLVSGFSLKLYRR